MKLRIEEIRYKNIREFGDLKIDLTKENSSETYDISLIQMPNGTGKTTTMGLIRHLILGTELDEDQVMDYAPEYEASKGEFTMAFATPDLRFRVHMGLDYEIGAVSYRHSYPQKEGGGTNSGHFLPMELEDALTEDFVDLFVFNGELTDDFIETGHDTAETALKIVSRLDRIEVQRDRIERVVEKHQDDSSATTSQGLKHTKTEYKKRKRSLGNLKQQRQDLKSEIQQHKSEIERLKDERDDIISENEDALTEYRELEGQIQDLKTRLHTESKRLLTDIRRPSKLSKSLNEDFSELLESMTILELPRSTSEEFFNELAEGDDCICGRELDEEHRVAIRENAQKYLSDEEIGVLNTLKEQLRSTAEPENFEARFSDLEEIRRELTTKETQQDKIDLGDRELEEKKQELTQRIQNERNDLDEKEEMLELLTTDDKRTRERYDLDWKTNIPEAKREVEKYRQKVQKATNTVEYGNKADILQKIFDEFIQNSLKDLKSGQIEKTNKKLSQILGLSEVQIESIDDSIKLEGKSGSSEGQSLSVAYAYLSTLFEDSKVDMPFVIDSPAVSLDHKVRREVASIISGLFDQLIAFVISTEKDGFVDNLEPHRSGRSDDIQYYTIHKTDQPGEVQKHTDKDFFMKFTSEEEERATIAEGEN